MRTLMFAIPLVTSLTFGAFQAIALETPPAPGEPKPFTLPVTSTYQLDNGLNVTLVPYGSTPKATVALVSFSGNQDEGEHTGIADLTYDLFAQGTMKRTAAQLATDAAMMGGELSTDVDMNLSSVSMDVLSEFAPDALAMIAEVVTQSQFEEDDLRQAIENRWRSVEVTRSEARGMAIEGFYAAMYGNEHPYGKVFPEQQKLFAITPNDVRRFASTNVVAKRSHLFVAGVFDEQKVKTAIEQAFTDLPQGQARSVMSVPPSASEPKLVRIDRPNAPQSTIRLGQRTITINHDDYIPLEVLNTMLGGMFSSRITTNIREDKGYTYSPRSSINSYLGASIWAQAADIQAESTGEAMNEILKEIRLIQSTPPSEQELQGVKNYMAGIFVLRNSSRRGVVGQLSTLAMHGLPPERLAGYVSSVNGVTAEQVSDLARRYLNLANMTLVVVGDSAQMDKELAEINGLPVLP